MAILEITSVAKSIGGSCASGTGSAMVGGFIGGSLRFGKGGSKMTGLTAFTTVASGKAKALAGRGIKRAGKLAIRGVKNRLRGKK
jgi:type IV secretion system protein VirB6